MEVSLAIWVLLAIVFWGLELLCSALREGFPLCTLSPCVRSTELVGAESYFPVLRSEGSALGWGLGISKAPKAWGMQSPQEESLSSWGGKLWRWAFGAYLAILNYEHGVGEQIGWA